MPDPNMKGNDLHEQAAFARHQEATFVTLLQKLAVAANEAESVDDALQVTLDILCDYTGWPIGHIYILSEKVPDRLEPTTIWHLKDPQRFHRFREVTEQTPLDLGKGLPGRVLASSQPTWVRDVLTDSNFPRAKQATEPSSWPMNGAPLSVGTRAQNRSSATARTKSSANR